MSKGSWGYGDANPEDVGKNRKRVEGDNR